jgi:putative redox protein
MKLTTPPRGVGRTDEHARSQVTIERISRGRFRASNGRGAQITVGSGDATDFTPAELLLAALGGCTSIDVYTLTSRRAEPDSFSVQVGAEKLKDERGANRLTNVTVTFRMAFPGGQAGDGARALLPDAVQQSHDRLCTVGRTIELGTPITARLEQARSA